MKLRISLRGLLILTACLAAFLYWRDRPRQNARRFIALIEAGDYSAADAMFDDCKLGISKPPKAYWDWEVEQAGQSPSDWLRGRYPLVVQSEFRSDVLRVEATATGLRRNDMGGFDTPYSGRIGFRQ